MIQSKRTAVLTRSVSGYLLKRQRYAHALPTQKEGEGAHFRSPLQRTSFIIPVNPLSHFNVTVAVSCLSVMIFC